MASSASARPTGFRPEQYVLVAWPKYGSDALWTSPEMDSSHQAEVWLRAIVRLLEVLRIAPVVSAICSIQVESTAQDPSLHEHLAWRGGALDYVTVEGWEMTDDDIEAAFDDAAEYEAAEADRH